MVHLLNVDSFIRMRRQHIFVPLPKVRTERGEEARDPLRGFGGRRVRRLRCPHRRRAVLARRSQLLLSPEDALEELLLRPGRRVHPNFDQPVRQRALGHVLRRVQPAVDVHRTFAVYRARNPWSKQTISWTMDKKMVDLFFVLPSSCDHRL